MADEDFNMSLRKFLKTVGVTSQQEIEAAVRAADPSAENVTARMVLTIEEIGLTHEVTGQITMPKDN